MHHNYVQHPALKSVYGKSQSAMSGKLFSFCRTVLEWKWERLKLEQNGIANHKDIANVRSFKGKQSVQNPQLNQVNKLLVYIMVMNL